MNSGILFAMWLFFTIASLVIYHKIFVVYYFNLSRGLVKEFVTACFVGLILTALTLYLWWLSAIILVLVGLLAAKKVQDPVIKKVVLIVFIVLAIIVSVLGIQFNASNKNKDNAVTSEAVPDNKDDMDSDKTQLKDMDMIGYITTNIDSFFAATDTKFSDIDGASVYVDEGNSTMIMADENSNINYIAIGYDRSSETNPQDAPSLAGTRIGDSIDTLNEALSSYNYEEYLTDDTASVYINYDNDIAITYSVENGTITSIVICTDASSLFSGTETP